MNGLMQYIFGGQGSPGFNGGIFGAGGEQPPIPGFDQFGIQLPPPPGAQVGPPPSEQGQNQHMGNLMGGGAMDPNMLQMILRMLGQGGAQ